ncbi:MAG: hypothetical protein IPJ00_19095 [Saprospirales bacterium]|nr:hypothetical protein [Saprospirales bacterium]
MLRDMEVERHQWKQTEEDRLQASADAPLAGKSITLHQNRSRPSDAKEAQEKPEAAGA